MDTHDLETRIRNIEARNKSVELDKAWETSWTRRSVIIGFTYLAIGMFLMVIRVDSPWLSAIVPAIGFTLSTLTMPYFKQRWIARQRHE